MIMSSTDEMCINFESPEPQVSVQFIYLITNLFQDSIIISSGYLIILI